MYLQKLKTYLLAEIKLLRHPGKRNEFNLQTEFTLQEVLDKLEKLEKEDRYL